MARNTSFVLGDRFDAFVAAQVASGRYSNAADVIRSGLRSLFHQVDVVREKDVAAYQDAAHRLGADPARAWMIGNSPRSDILPARAAGFGAVFVPHAITWALEVADLPSEEDPRMHRGGSLRRTQSFWSVRIPLASLSVAAGAWRRSR